MADQPISTEQSSDPQIAAVVQTTTDKLRRMRTFRRQYDAKRIEYYRKYIGNRDGKMFPDNITPRSNTFAMYPFTNVETIVSRVHDAFFTYEDWFEAKPRGAQDERAADAMQLVLDYKLKRANLVQAFETLVRNICIYGHAAIKVEWDFDYDTITKPMGIPAINKQTGQPFTDPATGAPIILRVVPQTVQIPKARPKFTAIDIFDLLIDPDGGHVAQLTEKPLSVLMREAQANPQLYDPAALQELVTRVSTVEKDNPGSVLVRLAEVWDEDEGTCTLITFSEDGRESLAFKDQRYASRAGANYSTFKRKLYMGPAILLWHGPNPNMHKQAPILHTSYVKLPNEVYGLGAVEVIGDLTDGMNKFINMITDNWNMNINKRYAYDVNADIDHEALNNFNVPGGKVPVNGNPNEILFPLPMMTPNSEDYQILSLYKNLIEMTSGISDFYARGVGSSGGNDTATGISSVITESNFRFKQFIRNLELDILQPLMQMCASLCQQYLTDQQEVQITDAPAGFPKLALVQPEDLLGSVDFDLVASNYASNKVIRQRNIMALASLLENSQYVNEGVAIREILKIFEVKDVDSLVKSDQQVAMEQQAALKQQIDMMMLEAMLQTESKARIAQSKPRPSGGKEGKPRSGYQPEGKIPGAGLTSSIRDFAQHIGGNAMGLGGNKE